MRHVLEIAAKEHPLLRVDGRVKLAAAILILMMVLTSRGIVFPVLVCAASLGLCLSLRVPLRRLLLRFSEPAFIALVLLVLKGFFGGKDPLLQTGLFGAGITLYRDGLVEGLLLASRIMAAVSLIGCLGFVTPFTEFMAGLAWFRVPRLFIDVLMFAYRALFLLFDDAAVIYQAQKNRLGYSTVRRGLSSFGVLAGSLTLKAFENSQSTAIAMIQRGYDGTMPLLAHKPFRTIEVSLSLLFVVFMGILWTL
ncbi:MAG: cobalt ECF transporter T component CbiQ [Thermodesulfovibrionales bacterium]